MHFTKPTVFGLIQSTAVLAANHQVIVGQNNGLTFTPTTLNAAAGDTVQFMFATQNHTVTAGTPNTGCSPSGQFYSGFVPAPGAAAAGAAAPAAGAAAPAASAAAGKKPAKGGKWVIRGENNIFLERQNTLPSFTVPIKNTQPITVYCSQAQHCQVGMVMVINPTQQGATSLSQYQQLCAKAKTNVIPPGGPNGGALANLVKGTKAGAGGAKAGAGAGAAGAGAATGTAGTAKAGGKGSAAGAGAAGAGAAAAGTTGTAKAGGKGTAAGAGAAAAGTTGTAKAGGKGAGAAAGAGANAAAQGAQGQGAQGAKKAKWNGN